jgi:hypothetical protein
VENRKKENKYPACLPMKKDKVLEVSTIKE